eukprot:symbB.v1.2.030341.t1/scaffold3410.1/size62789/2
MDVPACALQRIGLKQPVAPQVFEAPKRLSLPDQAKARSQQKCGLLLPAALIASARRKSVSMHAGSSSGQRVVVTGVGVVSPYGTDKEDFYQNLLEGKSAIKRITKFDPEGLTTQIAAEICDFEAIGYVDKKSERRMDDVVKFTIVGGKKALEDAGLAQGSDAFLELQKERCGILIGSAMGGTGLQTSLDNMDKLLKGKKVSPFFVPYTLVNVPGGLLAIDLGFQGPNYAVVTACATGNYCISSAASHIEKGECDVVLAGGAEASVTRAGIAGFIGCKALSSRNDEPEKASRPWDKGRDGFVMGEGAGVLCLEVKSLDLALVAKQSTDKLTARVGHRTPHFHSAFSEEACAIASAYVPHKSDVFIVTAPKTGTTLLQMLCHSVRTGGLVDFEADLQKMAKYICLVRRPEDVLRSWWRFLREKDVAGNGGKSSSSTGGGRGGEGPKEPREKKSRLGQELDEEDELIEGDRVEIGGELKSEQEYVSNRIFKFIHHFSGKTDFLSMAILEEASERKMKVVCISVDKENGGDLSSTFPYRDHVASIRKADVDGYHSGFPCNSYSRLRWRPAPNLPGPVRSRQHPYGLPGNGEKEQAEADLGTILMCRSIEACKAMAETNDEYKVPAFYTMENPPPSSAGDSQHIAAWEMPEMVKFIESRAEFRKAFFHTCRFQQNVPVGKRMKKPQMFGGNLNGLASLGRMCNCGDAGHVEVVGKEKSKKSGEYPQELCEAYAKLAVDHFEKMARSEFWDAREKVTRKHLNKLREKAEAFNVEAEKSKRRLEESKDEPRTPEVKLRPRSPSAPRKRKRDMADDLAAKDEPNEKKTASFGWTPGEGKHGAVRMSQSKANHPRNIAFFGGMRHPAKAVGQLPTVQALGLRMRAAREKFVRLHSRVLETAETYGTQEVKVHEDLVTKWREELRRLWGTKSAPSERSGDPECEVPDWLEFGCPLGIEREIKTCNIFPPMAEEEVKTGGEADMAAELERKGFKNYASVEDNKADAEIEIQRYEKEGYVRRIEKEKALKLYPGGTISRLGLVLKMKESGEKKRRVVIDLRRSGGNSKSSLPEKLVLPRPVDVVRMLKEMNSKWPDKGQDIGVEFAVVDVMDAFTTLPLHREEHRHALSPSTRDGELLLFQALLFGYRTAPLLYSRFASMVARLLQSGMDPKMACHQVYLDDSLWVLKGSLEERSSSLAMTLYTMLALQIKIALHKGERAAHVTWVGVRFSLPDQDTLVVGLPIKFLEETKAILESWKGKGMAPLKELRWFAGKTAWLANILPRARWVTAVLYAVMKSTEAEEDKVKSDGRVKKGLFAVARLESARRWLVAFTEAAMARPMRKISIGNKNQMEVRLCCDASPEGLGAVLVVNGAPVGALASPVDDYDVKLLAIEKGASSSQGVLEVLCLLVALKHWKKRFAGHVVTLDAQSDSMVALALSQRLAASSPTLNWLGAEMSLALEEAGVEVFRSVHIPGKANVEADHLSRPSIWSKVKLPEGLEPLASAIETPAVRDKDYYQLPGPTTDPSLLKLDGDLLGTWWGPAMDPGTMDAGGVASGGRPGLSLLVPVQHLLLGGLVRSAANPGNFADFSEEEKMNGSKVADFSEEEKMNGLKVQSVEEEPGEEEREQTEAEQGKESVDLDPVMEHETATWSPTWVEEISEDEEPAKSMGSNEKETPMSPLRKLVSKKWNELSRNLPPLGGLRALPPLSRLLKGGGEPLQQPSASRMGRSSPKERPKPKVVFKSRGSRKGFMAAVNRKRNKLLVGIEKDFYSDTSRAPKDSRRLTVKKVLKSEVVKLNVQKIKTIATAFKEAGYKSGSSYLAEAKLMHVEEGGEWTPQLDRVLDRGRGPRKKAPEVPLDVRKEANYRNKNIGTKVLFARELFQFGLAWMLREVEIRFFEVRDLKVNNSSKRVTLCWRTSKCDQEGGEVRRTLQCLCMGPSCAWECPFFTTVDLVDKVKKINGLHSKLALNADLTPTRKGPLLEAWCETFQMTVTGHSARRSGALHLIREGWDIPQDYVSEGMRFGASLWEYYVEFYRCLDLPEVLVLCYEDLQVNLAGHIDLISMFLSCPPLDQQKRGATIYAEYLGGAYTTDAYDMTAPHPKGDGVARCIQTAMKNAGVQPEEVGYLNCHGTSTPAGDMAEVKAIERAFDHKTEGLVVNSSKSMIGHCLGAAAGVEAVVTIQALKHRKVHPTINLEEKDDDFKLTTPSEAMNLPDLKVAASNSFGFGGHNSCVIFRRRALF